MSDAAEREYKALPQEVMSEFGISLRAIQVDKKPFLNIKTLDSIGKGVIELIINGSPAYRCIYIAKYMDTVVVLHLLHLPLAINNEPCTISIRHLLDRAS